MRLILSFAFLLFLSSIALAQAAPDHVLLIKQISVIDTTGASAWSAIRSDQDVLIVGDRIQQVSPRRLIKPDGAEVVDGRGKFLIPGLWDMHVHVQELDRSFPLFIANGVLGVRDMGGNLDDLLRWREQIKAGQLLGPRMVISGPILDGERPADPRHAIPVTSVDQARKIVQQRVVANVDFIKIYDGLARDVYFAIMDEARKNHLPVAGHVPNSVTAKEASEAGQRSIEHLTGVLEACSSDPDALKKLSQEPPDKEKGQAAMPARIAKRYHAELATYSDAKAADLFATFRKNSTFMVPTLNVKKNRTYIDDLFGKPDPRMKYVPKALVEEGDPKKDFFARYRTPEYIAEQKRVYAKELAVVGEMNRVGVRILAGTDSFGPYAVPGFSLHDELGLLVQTGLTPIQALRAATTGPAEFLGRRNEGSVTPGKFANMVVLDKNPLDDIRNTQSIRAVIIRGRLLDRATLDDMLASVERSAQNGR